MISSSIRMKKRLWVLNIEIVKWELVFHNLIIFNKKNLIILIIIHLTIKVILEEKFLLNKANL